MPQPCPDHHPGQSCLRNSSWHLRFSRMLTALEWKRIGVLLDLDPRTYDAEREVYVIEPCADIIKRVCPDVSMEARML